MKDAVTFPSRIVSLASSSTEILFALGAGDRLVGVSRYCDYTAEALEKPRVGGFIDADYAAVQQAHPDLVLTESHLQRDIVSRLIDMNLNVLSLNPVTLSAVLGSIFFIGQVIGCGGEAEQLVRTLQERIDRVRSEAKSLPRKLKVYLEEWGNPMIPAGGWEMECVELAGGVNVFHYDVHQHSRERVISPEDVIRANPELILVSWPGSCGRIRPYKIKQRPGWDAIEAVGKDHVFVIDDRVLVRPGPRVVDGLERIAEIIRKVAVET